jgi:hypothetical protein
LFLTFIVQEHGILDLPVLWGWWPDFNIGVGDFKSPSTAGQPDFNLEVMAVEPKKCSAQPTGLPCMYCSNEMHSW